MKSVLLSPLGGAIFEKQRLQTATSDAQHKKWKWKNWEL